MCLPGYGELNCATACGGDGSSATYGQGLRPLSTACVACPSTDLTVNLGGTNQTFVSEASSKVAAAAPGDCLARWASYGDSWYLPEGSSESYSTQGSVGSLSACLALCAANTECQFVTYLPASSECRVRLRTVSPLKG